MSAATHLLQARRTAELSQRELSRRTGVPQSAIARIERGLQVPRTDTLEKLLQACGFQLRLGPVRGAAVDRNQLQEWLAFSPAERLERATGYERMVDRLRSANPMRTSS